MDAQDIFVERIFSNRVSCQIEHVKEMASFGSRHAAFIKFVPLFPGHPIENGINIIVCDLYVHKPFDAGSGILRLLLQ